MVLVDTCVWVEHLRDGHAALAQALGEGSVLMHPAVAGELACGNLMNRKQILTDLAALPTAAVATDEEVMRLIDDRKLWGRGLGWIDVHLLASALLSDVRLWTFDKRLGNAAAELRVGGTP